MPSLEYYNIDADQVNSRDYKSSSWDSVKHIRKDYIEPGQQCLTKLRRQDAIDDAKAWAERLKTGEHGLSDLTIGTVNRHVETLLDERRRLIADNAELAVKIIRLQGNGKKINHERSRERR